MQQMRDILATIQSEYDYPVDIEFTINLSESGDYVINILQCRPLQVFKDSLHTEYPEDADKDKTIFENKKTITYNRELMRKFDNVSEESDDLSDIMFVYDVSSSDVMLCNDMKNNRIICFIKGE